MGVIIGIALGLWVIGFFILVNIEHQLAYLVKFIKANPEKWNLPED